MVKTSFLLFNTFVAMKNYQNIFWLFSVLLTLTNFGCNPNYYIPNTQNVPVISAKGQTNLTFAINDNQMEFQGAYGVTENLAIQANTAMIAPEAEDNGNGGSGKLLDVGLGYYYNILPYLLVETYGLAGFGKMENHFPTSVDANPTTTGLISANVYRFGFQPCLSYHHPYFSVTGSTKLMFLNYYDIDGSLIFDGIDQTVYLEDNKSNILVEPAITIRGGLKKVKLQIQLLKSMNLSNKDFQQDDGMISIGLNFNFK